MLFVGLFSFVMGHTQWYLGAKYWRGLVCWGSEWGQLRARQGLPVLLWLALTRCFPTLLPKEASEDAPPPAQNFIIPKKEIHTVPDMGKWKRSQVGRAPVRPPWCWLLLPHLTSQASESCGVPTG